jgi:predicted alpha/beta hydrolase
MPIELQRVTVTAPDGVTSELQVFVPQSPRSLLVFHTALGVGASYYEPFARAVAQAGHAIAVLEPRGVGSSSVRASRAVDFGYRELVELDLPAAIAAAREHVGPLPLLVGGHSLGGQVICLATPVLPPEVVGLVLIAAGTGWHASWRGRRRWAIQLLGYIAPVISGVLGWFPGKILGFGGREARTLMREWSHCIRTGRYVLTNSCRDWDASIAEQRRPVLTVFVEGDTWAPYRSMQHLMSKMPNAKVDHQEVRLEPSDRRASPHFRWAREPAAVVAAVEPWITHHASL